MSDILDMVRANTARVEELKERAGEIAEYIEALEAENERLRAALQRWQEWASTAEEFLPHEIMCCTQDGGEWCDCARADLLAEKPGDDG